MFGLDDEWKIHAKFSSRKEAIQDFKWLLKYATIQREFILITKSPKVLLNDEIPF